MFLSTTVPQTMLDARMNKSTSPYDFTIPYDFSKGRNIFINIYCSQTSIGVSPAFHVHDFLITPDSGRVNFNIPTDVDTFTGLITACSYHYELSSSPVKYVLYNFNINVSCDTVNNAIKFTPMSTIISGTPDAEIDTGLLAAPCLLTVQTIGATV